MTHSGSSKGFIVAAPRSGSGKTLITLGLLRAFRNRGLSVGSFKVGPDYIDPGFHEAATGLPCRNIDIWAMRPGTIANILSKTANGTDLIIGEGVMGLFDGAAGGGGSTADVATELGLPTILVVDDEAAVRYMASSAERSSGGGVLDPAKAYGARDENGALRVRVWRDGEQDAPLIDAASTRAALELGGAPWDAPWVGSCEVRGAARAVHTPPIGFGKGGRPNWDW